MKSRILVVLLLVLVLAPWACRPYLPISPNPSTPTPVPDNPTVTPTPNQTPVCGFTSLPSMSNSVSNYGQFVIQNQTEWANLNGTVAAPVDFSKQMVLEITCKEIGGCENSIWPSFVSVCVYSNYIHVVYNAGLPYILPTFATPVTVLPGSAPVSIPYQPVCGVIYNIDGQVMVAMPQSSLPVTWVAQ